MGAKPLYWQFVISPSSPNPVQLGLIGVGPWGKNLATTLNEITGAELVAAANSSGHRPDFLSKTTQFSTYTPQFLARLNLDAVIVATPPGSHAEIVNDALRSGLGVFVEKPLTLSRAQAQTILRQHQKMPAPLFVDHIYLFHAAYRALKASISAGETIRAISLIGGNRGPFRENIPVLWDWAAHDIAMCLDIIEALPSKTRAKCTASDFDEKGQNWEISMEFPDDCKAMISTGNLFKSRRRQLTVYTDRQTLRFEDSEVATVLQFPPLMKFEEPNSQGRAVDFIPTPPLNTALKEFCTAVLQRDSNSQQLQLAAWVVDVLEEITA